MMWTNERFHMAPQIRPKFPWDDATSIFILSIWFQNHYNVDIHLPYIRWFENYLKKLGFKTILKKSWKTMGFEPKKS